MNVVKLNQRLGINKMSVKITTYTTGSTMDDTSKNHIADIENGMNNSNEINKLEDEHEINEEVFLKAYNESEEDSD